MALTTHVKTIKDIDGKILFQGRTPSIKALVEQCVKSGRPLKRADLSGLDLSHLDLRRADFSEARLDGAKLRGCKMERAVFSGASMRGVSMSAVDAECADFSGVDFSPYKTTRFWADGRTDGTGSPASHEVTLKSDFTGATLTYSAFDRARIVGVDFSQCSMSSSTMTGVTARKSTFDHAFMHNVDWTGSKVVGNSFKHAKMTPTLKIDPAHLPDRTLDAVIVGNQYEQTEFGTGNRGFVADSFLAGKLRMTTFALVTSGLFVASAAIPFDLEGALSATIGKTATFVLAASAITWIKTPLEDMVKDAATDMLAATSVRVRSAISEMWKRGRSLASLSVAWLKPSQADHLEKVLRTHHGGIFARVKAALKGDYDVVVCDRDHLAEALLRMSEMMTSRQTIKHSLVLLRIGGEKDAVPRAVVLNKDGGVEALWDQNEDGKIAHMAWDGAKFPKGEFEGVAPTRFEGPFNSHVPVMMRFVSSVLADHRLEDFKPQFETHMIKRGRDGSIVVVKASNGRLDNKGGPAVVTPDDRRLYFRNSIAYDSQGRKVRPEPELSTAFRM